MQDCFQVLRHIQSLQKKWLLYREENRTWQEELEALEKLVTKRKQMEDKKLLEAYHLGDKTAEEIIGFIQSGKKKRIEG